MSYKFIGKLTGVQQVRAIELASRIGYQRSKDEDFFGFWGRVPISEARDHSKMSELGLATLGGRILFSSGGSTGTPKFTLLNFAEVISNSARHGKGYKACGIKQDDVVATWGVPGVMNSEFTVYLALSETGCCILPIGDISDPIAVVKLLRDFHVTVLLVMPSDLNPVINYLDTSGQIIESIGLVVTGGEPLLQADQRRFSAFFSPNVKFRSVYQTSDTGTIGFQCQSCNSNEFHVHDELQVLEIINIGQDGIGELLTTNMERDLVPVVRQRTGDLVRCIQEPCLCGRGGPRIQLCGRTGRFIKFGGEKFDLCWMSHIQSELGLPSNDFRMEIERDDMSRDVFRLISNHVWNDKNLQRKANNLFFNLSHKIMIQLEHKVVGELAFSAMADSAPLLTAGGKTQFFIDKRKL